MSIHSWADGAMPRTRTIQRISVGQATSAVALAIEAFLIVAVSVLSGIAFHRLTYRMNGDVQSFFATGILTAVLYSSYLRFWSAKHASLATSGFSRMRDGEVAWCVTFLFLLLLAFSLKISSAFSRGTIFSFFGAGLFIISISRVFIPRALSQFAFSNAYKGKEPIIVAPSSKAAGQIRHLLALQGCSDTRLVLFDDSSDDKTWPQLTKSLAQKVFDEARAAAPGEIYFVPGNLHRGAVEGLLQRMHLLPRAVYQVPDQTVANLLKYSTRAFGDEFVLEMQKAPLSTGERLAKRAFDLVVSGLALLLLAPAMLAICIAVKFDSAGPALFTQTRNGYRGRPFRILKFRTMRVMEDGDVVTQASRGDTRVTRLGQFLRKTSIDELPQLMNVLVGDMSIVGPRPHAAAHDKLYAELIDDYEVRQHVKPGITGWAQIQGLRGATPHIDLMYRRIEMDIWYATHCSLALDTQIVIRTFSEVLRQRNAF